MAWKKERLTAAKARELADAHCGFGKSLDLILLRVEEQVMEGNYRVKVVLPEDGRASKWIIAKLKDLGYTLERDEILW